MLQRSRARLNGQGIELMLVRVDRRFVLDELVAGRRVARVPVPELRPKAQTIRFVSAAWSDDQVGLDLYFVNDGSAKVIQRGYLVTADGFALIR